MSQAQLDISSYYYILMFNDTITSFLWDQLQQILVQLVCWVLCLFPQWAVYQACLIIIFLNSVCFFSATLSGYIVLSDSLGACLSFARHPCASCIFEDITPKSLRHLPIFFHACGLKEGSSAPPPPPTSRRTGSAPRWDRLPAPVREELVRQDFQIWTGRYQFGSHASAPEYICVPIGLLLRLKGKVVVGVAQVSRWGVVIGWLWAVRHI